MSVDARHIGYALPGFEVCVEVDRVRRFNLAIGGAADDPVPPTFLKVLEGEQQSSRRIVDDLSIDLRRLLHVEQQFDYLQTVRIGETLTIQRTVKDIQRNSARNMSFVMIESMFSRPGGESVAVSRQILMVRDTRSSEVTS